MRISGDYLAVEKGPTTYTSFACFRNFSLNMSRERYDATCGGDENRVYLMGKKSFEGSAEMVYDTENIDSVITAADAATPTDLRLIPNKIAAPGQHWTGPMYIDAAITVPQGTVTGTVNYVAAGNIVFAPGP